MLYIKPKINPPAYALHTHYFPCIEGPFSKEKGGIIAASKSALNIFWLYETLSGRAASNPIAPSFDDKTLAKGLPTKIVASDKNRPKQQAPNYLSSKDILKYKPLMCSYQHVDSMPLFHKNLVDSWIEAGVKLPGSTGFKKVSLLNEKNKVITNDYYTFTDFQHFNFSQHTTNFDIKKSSDNESNFVINEGIFPSTTIPESLCMETEIPGDIWLAGNSSFAYLCFSQKAKKVWEAKKSSEGHDRYRKKKFLPIYTSKFDMPIVPIFKKTEIRLKEDDAYTRSVFMVVGSSSRESGKVVLPNNVHIGDCYMFSKDKKELLLQDIENPDRIKAALLDYQEQSKNLNDDLKDLPTFAYHNEVTSNKMTYRNRKKIHQIKT